jgi:hypothetical protein
VTLLFIHHDITLLTLIHHPSPPPPPPPPPPHHHHHTTTTTIIIMALNQSRAKVPSDLSTRKTFRDKLNEPFTVESVHQQMDDLEKVNEAFYGFRHHAPRTQAMQDHHLDIYLTWVARSQGKRREDFGEEELDEIAFPENGEAMINIFRKFLINYYQEAQPRSKLYNDRISYSQMARVRENLMFWTRYKRLKAKKPPILPPNLFSYMAEAMRAVQERYPDMKASREAREEKTYIGLPEMRELFDQEMVHARDITNSEQHQAAWCIARVTSCRPGVLGKSGPHARNDPLKWSNIEFENEAPGKIKMTLTFRTMNIKNPNDPEKLARLAATNQTHVVVIEAPDVNNLIFSPAHRLLVIAIRRELLVDINTLDDLMAYTKRYIQVKREHRNDFVFWRSKAKGIGLDQGVPLAADALAEYLKRVCHKIGYTPQYIGFNSIRRRVASDLTSRIGADSTRRILGHSPESTTLEKYYLLMGPLADTTSLALAQPLEHGSAYPERLRRQWAPLVDGKLTDAAALRLRGQFLKRMVDRLAAADDNPPADAYTTEAGSRRYRKNLRLKAFQALLEGEKEQLKDDNTELKEHQGRQRDRLASRFAEAIIKRAHELQDEAVEKGIQLADDELAAADVPEEVVDDAEGLEEEPDVEDVVRQDGELHTVAFEQEEVGRQGDVDKVTPEMYMLHATAFMETLLDNTLNVEHTWMEGDTTCALCQDDDTVSEADKVCSLSLCILLLLTVFDRLLLLFSHPAFSFLSCLVFFCYLPSSFMPLGPHANSVLPSTQTRKWPYADKLKNHINSAFHSDLGRFKRFAHNRAEAHPKKLFVCPYCEELAADDEPVRGVELYKSLEKHIRLSTAEKDGPAHDEMKVSHAILLPQ